MHFDGNCYTETADLAMGLPLIIILSYGRYVYGANTKKPTV